MKAAECIRNFAVAALVTTMPALASIPRYLSPPIRPNQPSQPNFVKTTPLPSLEKMAVEQARQIVTALKAKNYNVDDQMYGQIVVDLSSYRAVEQLGKRAEPGLLDACHNKRPFPMITMVDGPQEEIWYFNIAKMIDGKLNIRLTGFTDYTPVLGANGTTDEQCADAVTATIGNILHSKMSDKADRPRHAFFPAFQAPQN